MKIGGILKNSFIDYPGKISSVIFLNGCNFKCPYCHNPGLANGTLFSNEYPNPDAVFQFLEERRQFLDGVVVSGGEPTLNDTLIGFLKEVKKLNYPIKLDTNGSRPFMIKNLIEGNLIDYIAIDIKTDPDQYTRYIKNAFNPKQLITSIEMIMASGIQYECRSTCVTPMISKEILLGIVKQFQGIQLYALQSFKNEVVLDPTFFDHQARGLSQAEMEEAKTVIGPFVQKCIVR